MIVQELFDTYKQYRESELTERRFKHGDILPLIAKRDRSVFEISEAGSSYQGKVIYLLKAGSGHKKILIWSQMHGNESTATQSLFDLFNLLENPGSFKPVIEKILETCTLYFVPMLNPDGAEMFKRRNAQDIDINRDALKLEAPESKILMHLRDELNPDFGINLHDQDIWYAVGNSTKPASISFLAPAFNVEKDIDEKRERSMQLISIMNKVLQNYIPGQTAKYYDDFMPTAFGDNIQKCGTSTILIESGAYQNDQEKQFVRKLNYLIIFHALVSISDDSYKTVNISEYDDLPFNRKNALFDYLLKNITVKGIDKTYQVDIGIRSKLNPKHDEFIIEDIGDLSLYDAFYVKDLTDITIDTVLIGDNAEFLIKKYFS